MKLPLVDLKAQYDSIRSEIDSAIERVLQSTAFILGPEVAAFEKSFATFCEARHAIGISSGTDALHLTLRACGVRADDEVITTPFTFIATAEAISMAGARPVFVDIDAETWNIDASKIEAAITERTRAIMPVHLFGQPADMDLIRAIADSRELRIIEDAAQAHGARFHGRRAGTLGDAACFSFYPGKNLGAYGDAGAVVTNDDGIAAQVRLLRDHGRRDKYEHLIVGYGNRLDALQAAILGAKLPHLEEWNRKRGFIAEQYGREFAGTAVRPQRIREGAQSVWHMYAVRLASREVVRATLADKGIATGVHYPTPLHLQPAYHHLGYERGAFPVAETLANEIVSLPIYPELPVAAVERVTSVVIAALQETAPAERA